MVTYNDSRYTYNSSIPYDLSYNGTLLVPLGSTQPYPTGQLTAQRSVQRALTGLQPGATGELIGWKVALVSLEGEQPPATGAVFKTQHYHVTLTGVQPTPSGSGVLDRVFEADRTLLGTQPEATGTIRGVHKYYVTLRGTQPISREVLYNDPLYTYNDPAISYNFSDPGNLSWRVFFARLLTGYQPYDWGELEYLRETWPWATYYPSVYDRPEEVHYVSAVDADDKAVGYRVAIKGAPQGVVYREYGPHQERERRR